MKKSLIAGAASALLVAAATAGCTPGQAAAGGDKVRIGVSFYTKTIPLYVEIEKGMRAEAKNLGADIEFAYADNSAETQSNQINTFVTKGVDVILASPIDVEALVPAYDQARQADIPVISVGNKVDDNHEDAFVGADYVDLAKQTMERTIQAMGGSGEVLELTGPPQIAFVQMQKKGWDEALAANPDVKVVDTLVVPDMTTGKAVDVANSGLSANPGTDAVVSSLDDISLGAIQAGESLNLDPKSMFYAGWDGGPAALGAVKDGSYDLTLSFRGITWGKVAVDTAVDLAHGKKPETHTVTTPVVFIDQKNIGTLNEADRQ